MRYRSLMLQLALAGALAACAEKSVPVPPPKVVKAVIVGVDDGVMARHFSGEIRARHESELGFRIAGKVLARLVDAGVTVRAGQPLARLDATDAALQSTQAEAQRTLAEADLRRYRDLRERNFISQSALDAKETAFKAADAQAGLARNQSTYTTLSADHDGVVAATLVDVGQVVGAGQAVIRLAHSGEREVLVNLPEQALAGVKPGTRAEVHLWSDGEKLWQGQVREVAPLADPNTRLYPVRISLPEAPAQLALGLSADVRFLRPGSTLPIVPASALVKREGETTVWVLDGENKVSPRPVQVKKFTDDGAVIESGLAAGELIVAAGAHKLFAGETVKLADPNLRTPR